jgi:dihydrodipicolinate synthase/N-acetylneuraminate lyase
MKTINCSYLVSRKKTLTPIFLTILFSLFYSSTINAQPLNDDCEGIIYLGEGYICPAPAIYNNIEATTSTVFSNPDNNIPDCFEGGIVERDVWFSFSVPADGSIVDYEIIISGFDGNNGSIINPQMAIYRGDCSLDGLAELACVSAEEGDTEAMVELTGLTPGILYFIRISDWSSTAAPNAGDFELCIQEPGENPTAPDDLPWALDPDCGTIMTHGIAAVSCGISGNIPAAERWVFGMMNLNDVMPASGRVDVSNDVEMYHHPSWHVDSIGNVFGITLDRNGNVFVTASSNYSSFYFNESSILRYGEIGGGAEDVQAAGTIYKIDGISGQASVFTVLPQQQSSFTQVPCEFGNNIFRNTGPGLGNITFSPLNKQFYATNFEDGRIYRLDEEGNIIDSYDPFGLDNGAAGAASLSELTYGIDISPDGARLFFGNAGEQGFFSTTAEIYSIDLNQDGSFVGTVNNSSMPTGATWDNYVGNETEHFEVTIELFSIYPEQLAISDMEFTPDGKLLVGCRAFCSNNIHSSYNHGGRAILLSPNNNGLYSINEGIIYTGFQLSLGNSRESYGGVSTFEEDGKILYAISSADMLIEEGPHGISLSEAGDFGSQGSPVSPAGIISYGSNPFTLDPKGIGGDIKFFVPCMEEQEESCSLESIDAGNDLDVCAPGQTVTLNGTVTGAFNTVEWTPSEGLSDPNSLTPMVDVSATTTYTLKAFGVGTTQNLIVNGDFTFGLTGFTSAYELGTGGPFGPLSEEGTYAVTTNTNFVHSNWASCTDHTTGTGNMLAVNAATMPDENIWCQTVAVTPDTDYEFSTWITSAIAENPPILQFSINDTLLGNPFSVPPTPCQWNQFFETWTSTDETSVEICITNQNTSQSGNDFAIDDISFGPVCTLEDEVTITVLDPIVAVADSIANIPCDNGGTGIVLDGTGSSIGADIEYLWSTDDGNIILGANTLMPLVNTAGTYTLTVLQLSSFDSCMVSAEVIVTQDTTTLSLPETVEICQGDSYTFDVTGFDTYEWSPADFLSCTDCPNPTATPPTTITYTLMASSTNGCTGSGSTEIIVLPFLETMLEFEACAGDSVDYNGTLLTPGSVTDFTFTAQSGCDSIVTVTVIELPTFSASLTLEACAGDSVDYNGTLLAPGSTTDFSFIAQNGCDSIVTVTVNELPEFSSSLTLEACAGDSVDYNGTLLAPGSTTDFSFIAQNGCDSIVTVTVNELPEFSSSLTLEACAGDSADYNGTLLAPGSTTDFSFTAQNGCDSIVTVTVNELPEFSSSLTLEACAGDSVDYNGTPLAPGTVTDFTFTAQNGCDSVVTVTVNELPTFSSSLTLEACAGDAADYNGTPLAPGTVTDFTFTAQNGCDSVVTVTVNELLPSETFETLTICPEDSVEIFGMLVNATGDYTMVFTAANGCDSTPHHYFKLV